MDTHSLLELLDHARSKLLCDGLHTAIALSSSGCFLVCALDACESDVPPNIKVFESCSYSHLDVLTPNFLLLLLLPAKAEAAKAKPTEDTAYKYMPSDHMYQAADADGTNTFSGSRQGKCRCPLWQKLITHFWNMSPASCRPPPCCFKPSSP